MTTMGFVSMSEERRIRRQLEALEEAVLWTKLSNPDLPSEVKRLITNILTERGCWPD